LNEYGIEPIVVDPQANREDTKQEYGIELMDIDDVKMRTALYLPLP